MTDSDKAEGLKQPVVTDPNYKPPFDEEQIEDPHMLPPDPEAPPPRVDEKMHRVER